MILDSIARRVGRIGLAVTLAVRSLTPIDTNPVPREWSHVTKIDPEYEKQLPVLYPRYLRHSSAVSVGGSRDVDSQNTEETFALLALVDVPAFHEPSAARHVTERTRTHSEFLAIPEVLNGDSTALVGTLGEGTEYLRDDLIPELLDEKFRWLPASLKPRVADLATSWLLRSAIFEAYIIQNPESAAAREANVTEDDLLAPREAAQRALAAEKHLGSPVVYLEYSGRYGGDEATEIIASLRETLTWSRIWYGGGLSSRPDALDVLEAGADTVVVGNVFHEIATEEVAFLERAVDHFETPPGLSDLVDWIAAEIDVRETAGFEYLSTIPGVDEPEPVATRYLAESLRAHSLLGTGPTSTRSDGRTAADDGVQRELETLLTDGAVPSDYVALLSRYVDPAMDEEDLLAALRTHVAGFR